MKIEHLKSKLKCYSHIFFDLDDTIYSISDFDNGAFFEISARFLNGEDIEIGRNWLMTHKNGELGKRLFFNFLSHFSLSSEYEKTCINLYQMFNCSTLDKKNSLYQLIYELKLDGKNLFLLTNGNFKRQERKINSLGLNSLFDFISIGDPNISPEFMKPTNSILTFWGIDPSICNCVMVGDNQVIDGLFAINANMDFIKYKFSI
jgi:FMN phosphatase YigB (HAD superfamily)